MLPIFYSCVELFVSIVGWFDSLLDKTGFTLIWYSAVILSLVYKFLFSPIFGYAKSDLSSRAYNALKRRKE